MMPASLEFAGVAAGRYDYTLGDRMLPTSEKLTVGATEITRALEFDDDRLATKTGPFSIERKGPAGAVSKITDGKLALTYAYDANGRPATRTLTVGGTERFFQKLTFDNRGRASGARGARRRRRADTLAYGYDGAGQLLTVKRGATVRREPHLRRRRQPARRRRGLRRPGPPDRPRRRRLHVGRRRLPRPAAPTRSPTAATASCCRRRGRLDDHVRLRRLRAARPRPGRRSTSTATRRTRSR